MIIRKSLPMAGVELKMHDEAGRFSGYASVFNGVDTYGDTILPGAFKDTLEKNGLPKMFFDHEWGLPIGKWLAAEEDEKGLRVEGELTPGNPQAEAVLAALKHGTVDGLSIGFRMGKGDFESSKDGGRLIKHIDRLFEVSVVTFPADGAARIDAVKSEGIDQIKTIRDFERFLRDAGGFSKSEASALVARAKALCAVQGDPEGDAEAKQILERLSSLESRIHTF